MFFSNAAEVPPGWRVRSAVERTYRYFEAGPGVDPAAYRRGAEALVGRVDVRSFGRRLPDRTPTWRDVTAVVVSSLADGVVVEVRAPSFVWGMVRKMISALRAVNDGTLEVDRIRTAVAGGRRLDLPLAEAEPLVLWDVRYPLDWTHATHRYGRHQLQYWSTERRSWAARGPLLDAIRIGGTDGARSSEATSTRSRPARGS